MLLFKEPYIIIFSKIGRYQTNVCFLSSYRKPSCQEGGKSQTPFKKMFPLYRNDMGNLEEEKRNRKRLEERKQIPS